MSVRRSAGTIFWGMTLIAIGGLLLARNLGYNIPIWTGIARWWPLLIIVWGLLKLVDYYRFKRAGDDRPVFSGGEVALLILVILSGSAITTAANISPEIGSIFHIGDFDLWDITGNNYEYTEHQEADAASESIIEIINMYGGVDVRPGATDRIILDVKKTVRAASKEDADRLVADFTFSIKNEGSKYRILSNRDDFIGDRRNRERQRFKSTLTVLAPKRSSIQLDNRNGKISLQDLIGKQTIVNRYGQVEVRGITGALDLENRNGSVEVDGITEAATITNSYSSTTAKNIGGTLDLKNRNGSVEVNTVKGDTHIKNSYSSVEVRGVTGSLELENRNGSVDVEDVTQSARITNSYSNATAKNIGGNLEINNRNGSVDVSGVKGNATISNSYAPITVENVQGEVTITGRNNSVDVEHVDGGVNTESSYQNVSIRDAKGAISVTTRNGDVTLGFVKAPQKDVRVSAQYSNVRIELPSSASFNIDARTEHGSISSEFEGFNTNSSKRDRSIRGHVGSGGPQITIDTRNGDIRLEKRG